MKSTGNHRFRIRMQGRLLGGIVCALFGLLLFPSGSRAALTVDAELRASYEDNVIGILSDQSTGASGNGGGMRAQLAGGPRYGGGSGAGMYSGTTTSTSGSRGDLSGTAYVAVGGIYDMAPQASLFLRGAVEHTEYQTFHDLDSTIGSAHLGIGADLGERVIGRIWAVGKVKRFTDSLRDSTAWGGGASLKERLTPSLWLRQSFELEQNDADDPGFSYQGRKAGAVIGYDLTAATMLSAGYSFLTQDYDVPAGDVLRTAAISATIEQELFRSWFAALSYERQNLTGSSTGASASNNLYSLTLRYAY